jgi:hypothetical protein
MSLTATEEMVEVRGRGIWAPYYAPPIPAFVPAARIPRALARHLPPPQPTTGVTTFHVDAAAAVVGASCIPFPTPTDMAVEILSPTDELRDPMFPRVSPRSSSRPRLLRPALPRSKTSPTLPLRDPSSLLEPLPHRAPPSPPGPSKAHAHKAKALSTRLKRRRRDEEETQWCATVHRSILRGLAQRSTSVVARRTPEEALRRRALEAADRELARRLGARLAERGFWAAASARDFPLPPVGIPRPGPFGRVSSVLGCVPGALGRAPLKELAPSRAPPPSLMAVNAMVPMFELELEAYGALGSGRRDHPRVVSAPMRAFAEPDDQPLPAPRLVARMTLRFRERAASRPRLRGNVISRRPPAPPSPLARFPPVVTGVDSSRGT